MWPFTRKSRGKLRKRAAQVAPLAVESGAGYELARFPDFDAYRAAQEIGNAKKIHRVFADPSIIKAISRYAADQITVRSILCHGTRNGAELRLFADNFPGAEILGTEIASSATQFPNTIQWDFHDFKEEWRDRWDVIYSNSWDHAMEPLRAFGSWCDSLRIGGLLFLEKDTGHTKANALDLFAADEGALRDFVKRGSDGRFSQGEFVPRIHMPGRFVLAFERLR